MEAYGGIIERYRSFLSVSDSTPVISLLEGNTPLIPSKSIGPALGIDLYFKYEGLNPTGSFKDRGMTMAISKAAEEGATAVMCASTGNTSAAAAAYAARAGMRCVVLIPEGKIALGKLAQAQAHGALVLAVKANFDRALDLVRKLTSTHPIKLVNSINPFRLEGQKTAAFEVCDDLTDGPEYLFIPVGNAGNVTAYSMGFREYRDKGLSRTLPLIHGCQAAGAAPIVTGRVFETPETIATAIRIGKPARWTEAEDAVARSTGSFWSIGDDAIVEAYKRLASEEGIFCEPASASSLAGLLRVMGSPELEWQRRQEVMDRVGSAGGQMRPMVPQPGSKVVVVLTGHGLKDPDTAISTSEEIGHLNASEDEIVKAIFGE